MSCPMESSSDACFVEALACLLFAPGGRGEGGDVAKLEALLGFEKEEEEGKKGHALRTPILFSLSWCATM